MLVGSSRCSAPGSPVFLGEVGGRDGDALGLPCAQASVLQCRGRGSCLVGICSFYLPAAGVCTLNFRGFITCSAKRSWRVLEAARRGPGSFLNSALRLGISQLA